MAARTNTDLSVLRSVAVAGRRQATADEVKAWGRDNGFTVNEGRGRMSNDLIDAFNEKHGKGKRKAQYVAGSKVQPVQDYTYTTAKGRKGKFQAAPADIRAWAVEAGLTEAVRGKFSQEILNAYGQALRAN